MPYQSAEPKGELESQPFPTTSSEQTDWQERPVSPLFLPPRHQQGAPIHANHPGKCSMSAANVNTGA